MTQQLDRNAKDTRENVLAFVGDAKERIEADNGFYYCL
jgi:hypothetical protein